MVQTTRHAQLSAALSQARLGSPRAVCGWSPQDEQVLRERYRLDGAHVLSPRLGRTPGSIRTKAHAMGLSGKLRPAARATQPVAAPTATATPKPAPAPERLPATPVLNANKQAKAKKEGPTPIGRMLEQMRKLGPAHPRCIAYAKAARLGNGQDAYQAWLHWKPEQAI